MNSEESEELKPYKLERSSKDSLASKRSECDKKEDTYEYIRAVQDYKVSADPTPPSKIETFLLYLILTPPQDPLKIICLAGPPKTNLLKLIDLQNLGFQRTLLLKPSMEEGRHILHYLHSLVQKTRTAQTLIEKILDLKKSTQKSLIQF